MSKTLDTLARERTDKALATIDEIMSDPFADNKDRLKAAIEMLDRGHGKPISATISIPVSKQKQAELARMSDADLMARIQSTPLPMLLAAPTPDAEFEDITHATATEHRIWMMNKLSAEEPQDQATAADFSHDFLS